MCVFSHIVTLNLGSFPLNTVVTGLLVETDSVSEKWYLRGHHEPSYIGFGLKVNPSPLTFMLLCSPCTYFRHKRYSLADAVVTKKNVVKWLMTLVSDATWVHLLGESPACDLLLLNYDRQYLVTPLSTFSLLEHYIIYWSHLILMQMVSHCRYIKTSLPDAKGYLVHQVGIRGVVTKRRYLMCCG